jgi:hypothetical protein
MNFMCLTQCAETECSLDMCSAFSKRSYIIGVSSLSDEQGSALRGIVAEELTPIVWADMKRRELRVRYKTEDYLYDYTIASRARV